MDPCGQRDMWVFVACSPSMVEAISPTTDVVRRGQRQLAGVPPFQSEEEESSLIHSHVSSPCWVEVGAWG